MTIRSSRIVRILFTAVAATAAMASSASAGALTASAGSCVDRAFETPFKPWMDPASYVLAPDGGLENGGAGWSMAGGAAVVSGNESFFVGGDDHASTLRLPPGSSAQTGVMCVGIEHPTLRIFTKASPAFGSRLRVEAVWEDAAGNARDTTIGVVDGGSTWAPSPVMVITTSLLTLLPGNHTPVAFRFTPLGSGTWTVDDVYVDPYAKY